MNKLNKIFNKSKRWKIDNNTKIVIMSDCHRGTGNNSDNFIKNQNIFIAALNYYYKNNFTYIELGDGDELWEVKDYKNIIDEHLHVFKILKKFHDSKRLIMIYGNHDIYKKDYQYLKDNIYKYYNKVKQKEEKLLNNLMTYESIVLEYQGKEILMIHGHQLDLLNGTFWKLARFLVKYLWHPLENIGIKDLTGAAKNYEVSSKLEKKFKKWSIRNNKILITGHTHRPIFPNENESLYFNDGSCIHPNGITCLEIENGNITLVRWFFRVKKNNVVIIGKVIIEGPKSILNFFQTNIILG